MRRRDFVKSTLAATACAVADEGDSRRPRAAYEHAPPSLLGAPLIHLGGVAGRVKPDATAFWSRDADHERRLRETYGGNYERLVQIKTKYDPTNLLRLNANIKPRA